MEFYTHPILQQYLKKICKQKKNKLVDYKYLENSTIYNFIKKFDPSFHFIKFYPTFQIFTLQINILIFAKYYTKIKYLAVTYL